MYLKDQTEKDQRAQNVDTEENRSQKRKLRSSNQ